MNWDLPGGSRLSFFKAGGTLTADSPSYIERPADHELPRLILQGEFCYILTARQLGKSSLMVRTVKQLEEKYNTKTAVIDLTAIGSGTIDSEAWYFSLLKALKNTLKLSVDLEDWWQQNAQQGPVKRFSDFLPNVILQEIAGNVVIFIDEIDYTLRLKFTDDFFAAIRAVYNARATSSIYNRITFVLLGVATPSALIADRTHTPFNIGHRIDLQEFGRDDAWVLQAGLDDFYPECANSILDRIFYWTNGHPYLTQKLCAEAVQAEDIENPEAFIDQLVDKCFFSSETANESNLRDVKNRVSHMSRAERRRLLSLYRQIYKGNVVKDNERSPEQNQLKLIGLVRGEQGVLQVRNELYRQVFDREWINSNTPVNRTRWVAIVAVFVALILTVTLVWNNLLQEQRTNQELANAYESGFKNNTNPAVRLDNLAALFDLEGFDVRARELFSDLSPNAAKALFENAGLDLQSQVTTVVEGTYLFLLDTPENNDLLKTIQIALEKLGGGEAKNLADEIDSWLAGRRAASADNLEISEIHYNNAIRENGRNPLTHLERAQVRTGRKKFQDALNDFERVLELEQFWQAQVSQAVNNNVELFDTLWQHAVDYPKLSAIIPTPTSTPTLTFTPIPPILPPTEAATSPTYTPLPSATPVTPTATPTSPPTGTPTSTVLPTPTPLAGTLKLLSPGAGANLSSERITTFTWQWDGPPLSENQAFEILIWRESEFPFGAYDARETMHGLSHRQDGAYSFTFDVTGAYAVKQNGNYLWSVALVELDPYQRTGTAAVPNEVQINVYGGGGGGTTGGGGGPEPTPTRASAFP